MLFAAESAGAVDAARFQGVLDLADTLVIIKVRMTEKATGTILRGDYMACFGRGSVIAAWGTASQLTPAVEGSDMANSRC